MSSPTLLRPPSQMLAYLPDAKAEPLAELLAAFANSDGGTKIGRASCRERV